MEGTSRSTHTCTVAIGTNGHKGDLVCWESGDGVDPRMIVEGIAYLKDLHGNCGADGGPRVCSRVSCNDNTAIYLCNDVSISDFPVTSLYEPRYHP